MRFSRTIKLNKNLPQASDLVRRYFTEEGYSLKQESEGSYIFERGKRWVSLYTFRIEKCHTLLNAELEEIDTNSTKCTLSYKVQTIGQIILKPDREFWEYELNNLISFVEVGIRAEEKHEFNQYRRRSVVGWILKYGTIPGVVIGMISVKGC